MDFEDFKADLLVDTAVFDKDVALFADLAKQLDDAGCVTEFARRLLDEHDDEAQAVEAIAQLGESLAKSLQWWQREVRLIALRRRHETRRLRGWPKG